ncbi:MAG: tetratricopeptide repeat protein, partial [Terriglobia bacterium]
LSPALEERGSFTQLIEVQGRLAWKILHHLDPTFPLSLQAFQQRFPSLEVSAFESYVRGLLAFSRAQQVRYFLQAARSDPGYSSPAFRLAQLYFEDQNYSTAASWFSKISPDDALALDARFYLSLCEFFMQDPARAAEILTPVAERLPVKQVWNNLGVFASRQEWSRAVDYFARALEEDPDDADVYFNLGLHHLRAEKWAEAARALEQCVTLNSGDTEAYFLLAHALQQTGRIDEANRARQQAVGDNPALALSLERRELDLDRIQQHFSARLAWLDRQRQESSADDSTRIRHVAVHVERGEDLLARGQLEPARREFTQAILLDPDSYRAHFLLAEIYRRQGRLSEAISELKASLWSQETVTARLRLAEVYLAQNRPADAREQVRAALALEPTHPAARALEAQLAGLSDETGAEGVQPQ